MPAPIPFNETKRERRRRLAKEAKGGLSACRLDDGGRSDAAADLIDQDAVEPMLLPLSGDEPPPLSLPLSPPVPVLPLTTQLTIPLLPESSCEDVEPLDLTTLIDAPVAGSVLRFG